MLRRYVEQIMNLYNYIDGMIVTDKNGKVEFFKTFRPDVNNLKEWEVLGKNLLDVYPTLDKETSSIFQVLKTGKPITNKYQTITTFKGQNINAVNTTMPIMDGKKIIGAVDVSRYIDSTMERQSIMLSLKEVDSIEKLYEIDDIITSSQNMASLKERIPMIADTESAVLICGETGTGKELVAQSIHTCSYRRSKRFVSQNCAAIPSTLLESILFGTTKGSYTGAENKAGLFEVANGGTLFLDEINSMEISIQAKILKAVEDKKITRIGGTQQIPIDIKIVSAINENPLQCIKEKKLREDLFYRLSVVQLNIPPLRERINDLFFLVNHFITTYNSSMNRNIIGLDEEVEEMFRNYQWYGNVRELKNIIEGAFNIASSRFIQKKDLPEYFVRSFDNLEEINEQYSFSREIDAIGFSLEEQLKNVEKKYILAAIQKSENRTEAAKLLGISKQALNYKIGKYNITQ